MDELTPWHCRECKQWAGPTPDFARRCEAAHAREAARHDEQESAA